MTTYSWDWMLQKPAHAERHVQPVIRYTLCDIRIATELDPSKKSTDRGCTRVLDD